MNHDHLDFFFLENFFWESFGFEKQCGLLGKIVIFFLPKFAGYL